MRSSWFATSPYLSATMKESFRLTLVFQLPLPYVIPPSGQMMASQNLPGGMIVRSISYCISHSPDVWGSDVEVSDPTRWTKAKRQMQT
jgi:cytochrome P450